MRILLDPRAESVGLRGKDRYVTMSIQAYKIPTQFSELETFKAEEDSEDHNSIPSCSIKRN